MITNIIMPALGDTMNEGTIVAWCKREGEWVDKGEPLFEVLTDKANIEVEAMASGYVRRILHDEGQTVPVTQTIAYLSPSLEEPLPGEATREVTEQEEPKDTRQAAPGPSIRRDTPKVFASPRARRLADETGVDLRLVTPSSRSGRIVEADVRRFIEQQAVLVQAVPPPQVPAERPTAVTGPIPAVPRPPAPESAGQAIPLTGVRKLIADRMAASHRDVARVTLFAEADATELVALRQRLNQVQPDLKLTYTDLLVAIVAAALRQHPVVNSTLTGDEIRLHDAIHIGIAVDTDRGLLVPVLHDADRKGLAQIASEARDLVERGRTGRLGPDELRGGTFTITNLGLYDIDGFTPIVNPPEAAILGVGRIGLQPVVRDGQVVPCQTVILSLSFDHRVVDGGPAARFLQTIKRLVEEPALLLV
jgi:pyruvate dehydrogenase E2 component (dihydrolipoamide acetyltransferase)